MRIAINMLAFTPGHQKAYEDFILQVLRRLTESLPEHEFILIFDRFRDKRLLASPNITHIVVGAFSRNPLIWMFWMDVRIPAELKKLKANVFVSAGWCSLTTKVPQCLLVPSFRFSQLIAQSKDSRLLFAKDYLRRFLKKSQSIATGTESVKQKIIDKYRIEAEKIDVVYDAGREMFKPVSIETAAILKNSLMAGKEFFFYAGPIDRQDILISVLKAFSIFKKRQKSNMKLVLAGSIGRRYDSLIEALKTYKYRDDLIMLTGLREDELANVTGSAYALLYVGSHNPGLSIIEAINCHIPVIADRESVYEIAGDAVLYVDTKSLEDIADKMMLIYKDDNLRKTLIEKEKIVASQYSWQRTAELLWKSIRKAVD